MRHFFQILIALGSLAGCRGSDVWLLPEVEWSGEHVDYGQSADVEACGGAREYTDAYVGALKTRLGADPGLRVEYYWLDETELTELCGEENTGCTGASIAKSAYAVHPHELVHAVRDGVDQDDTYAFFEEGLASAWGVWHNPSAGPKERSLISNALPKDFDTDDYLLATDWVGYLLDTYGDESLAEFSAMTSRESSYGQAASAFEDVIGPVDLVIDEFVNAPSCGKREFTEHVFPCVGPAPTYSCDGTLQPLEIACGSADTVGPLYGKIWRTIPIEVPTTGNYRFHLSGPESDSVEAELRACGSGCQLVRDVWVNSPDNADFNLIEMNAGDRYSLTVATSQGESGELDLTCEIVD